MVKRISAILCLDVVGYTTRMAEDTEGTFKDLQRLLSQVIRPLVRDHSGRIFKLMGDGALVEFASAAAAIRAANGILLRLQGNKISLRAGIHVGDVTANAEDVFGEAVNLAARLQASASPGGCLISRTAVEVAGLSLDVTLKPENAMRLKGLPTPVDAYSIDLHGDQRRSELSRLSALQDIRFTRSKDGTSLAWTTTGQGRRLVKSPHWLQHLEYEWTENALEGWLPLLSERYRLVRFDGRNNGLSERRVSDISLERFVDDLEAIFDAAKIDRAPVFGLSYGATVAAAFAAMHPDRVSGLVLMNGFAQGLTKRGRPADAALGKAIMDLSRDGWDDEYPSARDLMAQSFAPSASLQDQRGYAKFMKHAMDQQDWLRVGSIVDEADVSQLLPEIQCPTLVLHASRDRMHGNDQGRRLAAGIPNARFVALDTTNNTMPVYDPAWHKALKEMAIFFEACDQLG